MRHRPLTLLLVLALAVSACGSFGSNPNAAPSLIAVGETLDLAGGQFVTIGGVMNRLLDSGAISSAQYDPWRKFAPRFKEMYPLTVHAWLAAKRLCAPPPPAVLDAASCTARSEAVKAQASSLAAEVAALAAHAYLYIARSGPTPAALPVK